MKNRIRLRERIEQEIGKPLSYKIMGIFDECHVEPAPLHVGDRTAAEFEADFGGPDTFDFKIALEDGGVVFVVLGPVLGRDNKRGQIFLAWHFGPDGQFVDYLGPVLGRDNKRGQIFLAWHFGPDGQFVDYVERLCPPQGISDYEWLAEVCAEIGGV